MTINATPLFRIPTKPILQKKMKKSGKKMKKKQTELTCMQGKHVGSKIRCIVGKIGIRIHDNIWQLQKAPWNSRKRHRIL